MYPPFYVVYTDVFYTDDDLIKVEKRCNYNIYMYIYTYTYIYIYI